MTITSGRLTTHVLDTAAGQPARDLTLHLQHIGGQVETLLTVVTNTDGRVAEPLLQGDAMQVGTYQLIFLAGDYFRGRELALPAVPFLDEVVVRFGISDAAVHYHVPLLLSPYGYSTYRGS